MTMRRVAPIHEPEPPFDTVDQLRRHDRVIAIEDAHERREIDLERFSTLDMEQPCSLCGVLTDLYWLYELPEGCVCHRCRINRGEFPMPGESILGLEIAAAAPVATPSLSRAEKVERGRKLVESGEQVPWYDQPGRACLQAYWETQQEIRSRDGCCGHNEWTVAPNGQTVCRHTHMVCERHDGITRWLSAWEAWIDEGCPMGPSLQS